LMIMNTGTKRLKTAKTGMFFGEIKGRRYDNSNSIAKIELSK